MKRILLQLVVKKEKQPKGKLANKKMASIGGLTWGLSGFQDQGRKAGRPTASHKPWNSHVCCIRGVDHIPWASPGLRALGTESGWVEMGVGEGERAGPGILLL